MILERHFYIHNLPQSLSLRQALNSWLVPRKWQHELRVNRSILVNNHYQSFNQMVTNEDRIDLAFNASIKSQIYDPAKKVQFSIYQEDGDCLIINKPENLKTHPNQPHEQTTLMNQVRTYLNTNPFMIHRLDKMTSGLIMVGKNPLIVPIMNRQLATKIMQRFYVAVVIYNPDVPIQGQITTSIGRDLNDPRKRMITSNGLSAHTNYSIIQHNSKYALVKLELHSGRTHQIRVHLQSLGMPILGDPLYGPVAQRMYLHAYCLKYKVPFDQQFKTVITHIPKKFWQLTQ